MKPTTQEELIYLDMTLKLPFKWAAGELLGEWLTELKNSGKIYANKCPECGRHYCPPARVCTRDHTQCEPKEKWIEAGPKGTVVTFFVSEQSFLVPTTGKMLEVPFSVGIVLLDGAPVSLQHKLEETDPQKIKPGMRVEAVFKPKEQRTGSISDIVHFKTIN